MTPPFMVPTIDISPYTGPGTEQDRATVSRQMDAACREVGFVQILGHGIPDEVLAGLADATDEFFNQPIDVKNTYRVHGANRGYSPPKSESLSLSLGIESTSGMNDFFEAFNVGSQAEDFPELDLPQPDYAPNLWPESATFQHNVTAYYREAGKVANTLTTIFADALGQNRDFFEDLTDHSVDVLRLNNYALPAGTSVPDGEITGMGEHTDFGIVTVLWADQVPGLQVLGSDGIWHDVSPVDGALLVNLGDLTARLTNDQWMSTLHRVKPPIVDGTVARRRSVAFFHDGNVDAVISTLTSHLDLADGLAYEPITVGDHIKAKLAGSRQGKANTSAVREALRVTAARANAL